LIHDSLNPHWDHPRSRGVYLPKDEDGDKPDGSSPLARGLPARELGDIARVRIIPARAGFTSGLRIVEANLQDHPRSRGVYCPR